MAKKPKISLAATNEIKIVSGWEISKTIMYIPINSYQIDQIEIRTAEKKVGSRAELAVAYGIDDPSDVDSIISNASAMAEVCEIWASIAFKFPRAARCAPGHDGETEISDTETKVLNENGVKLGRSCRNGVNRKGYKTIDELIKDLRALVHHIVDIRSYPKIIIYNIHGSNFEYLIRRGVISKSGKITSNKFDAFFKNGYVFKKTKSSWRLERKKKYLFPIPPGCH